MPDFSESMEFKIFPNTGEINPAFESWGKKADDLSTRVGQAMIRGMSVAAGAGTMTQPRSTDPMAALTTIPEQERLLKMQVEQAGPLLRRMNIYKERQDQKAQEASRREFMGGLGRAAMGEAIGEVGGLGGVGAMVAGGVTPAALITGAVEIVKKPFDILARAAENSSRSLAALNSNIGVAAQGFENAAARWRWVPLVGEQMARMKDAERHEAETKMGWAKLITPGGAYQMEMANLRRQATEAHIEEQKRPIGERVAGANVLSSIRRAQSEIPEGDDYWEFLRTHTDDEVRAMERRAALLGGLAKEVHDAGDMLTEKKAQSIMERGNLPAAINPALPAQITSIEDYLSNLYTSFAGLPDNRNQNDAVQKNTEALNRMADAIEDNGKDHAEEGVDRAMAGDDEIAQLERNNPWWR